MATTLSKGFKHILNQSTTVTTNLINHNHVHFPVSTQITLLNHNDNHHDYNNHHYQHNHHDYHSHPNSHSHHIPHYVQHNQHISVQMQIQMQVHVNINGTNGNNNNNNNMQQPYQYGSGQPQPRLPYSPRQPPQLQSSNDEESDLNTEERQQQLLLLEQTCALIKPETVKLGNAHAIIDRIQEEGFNIIDIEKMHLSESKAKQFYSDHKNKKFFHKLLAYMTSGPIYALNLQKTNGVQEWRSLMGPTDAHIARQLAPNTLRAKYGTSKAMNAVHGSDSKPNAKKELSIMFT